MMKKSLLLLAGAFLAVGASAATLSPEEALARLGSSGGAKKVASIAAQPALSYVAKTPLGEPAVYVFNKKASKGFMLLSADDAAAPVLGYSDSGSFDPDNIPPQLAYWLEEYSSEIDAARKRGVAPQVDDSFTFPSDWTPIAPLLSTAWGQNYPYNMYTPKMYDAQGRAYNCVTGCVATATAQVMNYWKYPEQGTGSITYDSNTAGFDFQGTLTMNFGYEESFDWKNMADYYLEGHYDRYQAAAVANLMKQVGYSIQTQYGVANSGAPVQQVGVALMKYFGYSKGITIEERLTYTASDWNAMLYDQLKSVGPAVYCGSSPAGLHCFVADGYDGDGYFHFNWGWDGMADGFYLLNALNPSSVGTGGSLGGFNSIQGVVAGIQPEDAAPLPSYSNTLTIYGTFTARRSTAGISFSVSGQIPPEIANESMIAIHPRFGFEVSAVDSDSDPVYLPCSYSFPNIIPGAAGTLNGVDFSTAFDMTLPDGTYKMRIVFRDINVENAPWQYFQMAPNTYDYVYVTKKGSVIDIENMQAEKLVLKEASIVSDLYYNNSSILEVTFANPYDMEITQSVIPYLYANNSLQYWGDNYLVTLMPNETKTFQFQNNFQAYGGATVPSTNSPAVFGLVMANYNTGETYGNYGTVEMYRASTTRRVTQKSLEVTNSVKQGSFNYQNKEVALYSVDDLADIDISTEISMSTSKNSFISSPLVASLYVLDVASGQALEQVYEKQFEDLLILDMGESKVESTNLNYMKADPYQMYLLQLYYSNNGARTALGNPVVLASVAGVDDILAGDEGLDVEVAGDMIWAASSAGQVSIKVYDTNGALVAATVGSELNISSLVKGLYIVMVSDSAANVKTLKFVK